ncbi:MAG: carbon storage regulator CsrA [Solirubrobacteraceae bacterium]
MLVLTRRSNQSIMIGDDIEVSVLSVMGDKVRIGIDAPSNVPVFRTEIYLEIQSQEAEKEIAKGDQREVADGQAKTSEVADAIRRLGESS